MKIAGDHYIDYAYWFELQISSYEVLLHHVRIMEKVWRVDRENHGHIWKFLWPRARLMRVANNKV